MASSMTPFATANTSPGTMAPTTSSYPTSPKNGLARYGPASSATGPEARNPTTAQRTQRRAGQRSDSDAGVALRTIASPARAPRTISASSARHVATGDAGFAQSEPSTAGAGAGKPPQNRLSATGTAAAHDQRTGASRTIAIAAPAASPTRTARRTAGTAAARTSSPSGTAERARSTGSLGR